MGFISSSSGSFLGVDIGTTGIKIVELKKEQGRAKLVSYGAGKNAKAEQCDWQNNAPFTAKIINKIYAEAGMTSRSAVSALPTFSVFSSIINIANVAKKDLAQAVQREAKKIIPMALEDMILDWKNVIDDNPPGASGGNTHLLLTGAPRQLVKKYINIFKEAKINLLSLETETFSLIRSLLGNDKSTVMIVEIGAASTDISVIDKSIPMLSRSLDVGGRTISKNIADRLNIDFASAEQFKCDLGASAIGSKDDSLPAAAVDAMATVVNEIKYAANLYSNKYGKTIEKIVLSGGSALLPNLPGYLGKALDMKVIIGDPWARVSCPVDLEPLLNEIGPSMSIAAGLALREID